MKLLFNVPEIEIIPFTAEVLTVDHNSLGDGDVNVRWDDLE